MGLITNTAEEYEEGMAGGDRNYVSLADGISCPQNDRLYNKPTHTHLFFRNRHTSSATLHRVVSSTYQPQHSPLWLKYALNSSKAWNYTSVGYQVSRTIIAIGIQTVKLPIRNLHLSYDIKRPWGINY